MTVADGLNLMSKLDIKVDLKEVMRITGSNIQEETVQYWRENNQQNQHKQHMMPLGHHVNAKASEFLEQKRKLKAVTNEKSEYKPSSGVNGDVATWKLPVRPVQTPITPNTEEQNIERL